jgi:Zn finger protein HypA/HybF involved in hydrogenase expression
MEKEIFLKCPECGCEWRLSEFGVECPRCGYLML